MAIKVKCGKCDAGFKAKDSLAGRRVKCPKCKEPLTIPAAAPPQQAAKAVSAAPAASHNPLLDLLDEQNIRQTSGGAMCENCAGELEPGAFICMECGFNHQTGGQLQTEAHEDDSTGSESGMTDADRIMAKAEKDIDDMPVAADDQDFGDGAASYLIAGIAFVIGMILIGVGIVVIFSMDYLGTILNSGAISFIASCGLYLSMAAWITTVAFRQKPGHGIACLCTGFLWCIVYGFLQGKSLLLPTVIMIAGFLIGAASGAYVSFNGFEPVEGAHRIEWKEDWGAEFELDRDWKSPSVCGIYRSHKWVDENSNRMNQV